MDVVIATYMNNVLVHTVFMLIKLMQNLTIMQESYYKIPRIFLVQRLHENSEGLSSATNPKPKGLPSHCLLRQAYPSKRQSHLGA